MTQNIIHLPPDLHRETQLLLPWYAAGSLTAADAALVEAHLDGCADCQAELKTERRLRDEVRDLPVDVDQAWASMARRFQGLSRQRPGHDRPSAGRRLAVNWRPGRLSAGLAVAAALVLFVLGGLFAVRPQPTADYRTLSAAQPAAAGNVVVIFRPNATEAQMRLALRGAHARLVGGPTAADAYILSAPDTGRAAAIERLRANAAVILAEPIDTGQTP